MPASSPAPVSSGTHLSGEYTTAVASAKYAAADRRVAASGAAGPRRSGEDAEKKLHPPAAAAGEPSGLLQRTGLPYSTESSPVAPTTEPYKTESSPGMKPAAEPPGGEYGTALPGGKRLGEDPEGP